jgi:hypothetical protein
MRYRRSAATMALLTIVVACDKTPTAPTSLPPPTGTPPAAPSISVELEGPVRIAPGQSVQYTVVVHSSDGVARAPSSTRWIASPPSFLQVDAFGLATGGQLFGGAAVTADVIIDGPGGGARRVSKSVATLPDGTYRIFGTVVDEEFNVPVPNALVEVTPGSLTTVTSSEGSYSLYGVAADAEFQITAYGYAPYRQHLRFSDSGIHLRQDFRLSPSGQPLNLAGNFTLAIDVIDGCLNDRALPANLQHRAYDAVITQAGLALQVTLTEPRFSIIAGGGNRFGGRVNDSGATFDLDADSVRVVERLPDGAFLFLAGSAVSTGSAAGLAGTLDGYIESWDSRFPDADSTPFGGCYGRHSFRLTPR